MITLLSALIINQCIAMNQMKTLIKDYTPVFIGEEFPTKDWIAIYKNKDKWIAIRWTTTHACLISRGDKTI